MIDAEKLRALAEWIEPIYEKTPISFDAMVEACNDIKRIAAKLDRLHNREWMGLAMYERMRYKLLDPIPAWEQLDDHAKSGWLHTCDAVIEALEQL